MKKLFLALMVIISACSSNKLQLDELTNKRVETYKHNDFTFNYPKNWRILESKGFEQNIIVRVAPKSEISKCYMAIEKTNKEGVVTEAIYYSLSVDKDSIPKKHRVFINPNFVTEVAKNQFNISIDSLREKSLSDFISKREKKIAETDYVSGSFKKINDNHFINRITIINNDKTGYKYHHLMHYYYRKGKLYTLVSTRTDEINEKNKTASDLIFRTFHFTD